MLEQRLERGEQGGSKPAGRAGYLPQQLEQLGRVGGHPEHRVDQRTGRDPAPVGAHRLLRRTKRREVSTDLVDHGAEQRLLRAEVVEDRLLADAQPEARSSREVAPNPRPAKLAKAAARSRCDVERPEVSRPLRTGREQGWASTYQMVETC